MNPTNRSVEAVADGGELLDAAETSAPAVAIPTIRDIAEREGEFLWLTMQRLGVRQADCRDVVQDVLMVVHRKLHTFDGRSPLRAWLYGICVREASNHRRRAWVRRERPMEPNAISADKASDGNDPERALSERQQHGRIEAMLDELDPEKRAVLVMYEVEEQSCEQIASAHGIPVGTVHSRLHAARNAFRAVFARWTKRESSGGRK